MNNRIKTILASGLCALSLLMTTAPADAVVTINITEEGNDVVARYNGTIDVDRSLLRATSITSTRADLVTGGNAWFRSFINGYEAFANGGGFVGFGPGGAATATSNSGSTFGYLNTRLYLPRGYVAGDLISGSMTFAGQTLDSLGIQDGLSVTKILTSHNDDRIVLNTGSAAAPVPLPAGLPMLLAGLGAFGLLARRARRSVAH